jgi:hypothetical protein
MKDCTSRRIAMPLLTIVAGATVAISFAKFTTIKTTSEALKLQPQTETQQARVIVCRRQSGTRGSCQPPTPWS